MSVSREDNRGWFAARGSRGGPRDLTTFVTANIDMRARAADAEKNTKPSALRIECFELRIFYANLVFCERTKMFAY